MARAEPTPEYMLSARWQIFFVKPVCQRQYFKNLWVDISIREYEIAPNGVLDPEWQKLFLDHSDRITIGSDTWINSQWDNYQEIIAFDRNWLSQLPRNVAAKIAYQNAKQLFD